MQRFGYVDTGRGQVHFREAGSGPAVVLLHWGPGTSAQYSAIVDELAARGFRAIAPDLPGFGRSLRREGHWSVGDFADSVLECLAGWELGRCTLVGGHLASLVAMEAARRAPQRFVLVALDGTPVWDEALRRDILAKARPAPMVPREDGEHLKELWKHLLWEVKMWRPQLPWGEEAGRFAMQLVKAKLLADFDTRPMQTLLEYDVFAALADLQVPVLALSATDDPLFNCHESVLARVAGSTGHVFQGDHPVHSRAGAPAYVAPILERLRGLGVEAAGTAAPGPAAVAGVASRDRRA
ncbi:MAG: alpha/beta hydrolase [Steroidobacteraceae bacterium]|jgi:pimeloyl-ACP methyl ester carboxylesterase|nr:alpha/beta hydrolase [Steroidobacteraceae bacterium]